MNKQVLIPSSFIKQQLDDGFLDISPDGDYSLLKRTIKDGIAGESPSVGCPIKFHFITRVWKDEGWNIIAETTRDLVDGLHVGGTDDPNEIKQLGRYRQDDAEDEEQREKMDPNYLRYGRLAIWDTCMLTMNPKEISQFVCDPNLAYGNEGYSPNVPGGVSVMFEFEIVSWKAPLPYMPTRAEMAQAKQEREEEERKKYLENPPPSMKDRIKISDDHREEGNSFFLNKEYEKAKKAYDSAFVAIFCTPDELNFVLLPEDRDLINDAKVRLHLNRSLAKLKLEQYKEALWDCNQALEIDPFNTKGLYRHFKTNNHLLEKELDKEIKKEFWLIEVAIKLCKVSREDLAKLIDVNCSSDPNVRSARKHLVALESRLKEYSASYKQQQLGLFRDKIWKNVEKENASDKEELALEEDIAFDDMPVLED